VVQRVGRTGQLKVLVMNDDLHIAAQGNGYGGLAMEFVAEVQKELSEALNKPVTVTPVPAQSVEQGLDSIVAGSADIACGVSYSWGPAMVVDYTLPFALTGVRLLTPGNDGTPTALAGQRIGVVKNFLAASTLAAGPVSKATLVPFETPQAALTALSSGQIEIFAGDSLWLMANRSAAANNNLAPQVHRFAMACIIPNSGILNLSNLAIARLMQPTSTTMPRPSPASTAGSAPGRPRLNLSQNAIQAYFTNVLLSAALVSAP
jgi:polar amino acid transport system substrate-binding protein